MIATVSLGRGVQTRALLLVQTETEVDTPPGQLAGEAFCQYPVFIYYPIVTLDSCMSELIRHTAALGIHQLRERRFIGGCAKIVHREAHITRLARPVWTVYG